jgi:hypothetical protein
MPDVEEPQEAIPDYLEVLAMKKKVTRDSVLVFFFFADLFLLPL